MKTLYAKFSKRQSITHVVTLLAAVLFAFSFASNVSAAGLKTVLADKSDVQGTFTLILYGGISASDPENVAILKREGDGYSIEIAAPGRGYTVMNALSANVALAEAEKFLRRNIDSRRMTQLAKIISPSGDIIGFEVKSLYEPDRFGMPVVVNTHYTLKGDAVRAWIRLDPNVEMALRSGS